MRIRAFFLSFLLLSACHGANPFARDPQDALLANRVAVALYKNGVKPRNGGLNIRAEKGIVTLTGKLDDLSQMEDMLFIVEHTPGVSGINNRVQIRE